MLEEGDKAAPDKPHCTRVPSPFGFLMSPIGHTDTVIYSNARFINRDGGLIWGQHVNNFRVSRLAAPQCRFAHYIKYIDALAACGLSIHGLTCYATSRRVTAYYGGRFDQIVGCAVMCLVLCVLRTAGDSPLSQFLGLIVRWIVLLNT